MSKYCIVGTNKLTNKRKSLSQEYDTKEQAEKNIKNYTDSLSKKIYKYVKVAKCAYKERNGGDI